MENNLPIVVFKITEPDSLRRVVLGEAVCTVVGSERVTRVGFSES
jgi:uridylate kinase